MRSVAILLVLLTVGCSSVTTLSPLPADLKTPELDRFRGAWQCENDVIHVAVRGEGVACIAGISWEDSAFAMKQGELTVTRGEHRSFFCLAMYDSEIPPDQFLFLQYHFLSPDELIVWQPRIEAFRAAVDNGELTAADQSTDSELVLDVGSSVLLAFLDDPSRTDLFDYEQPLIFRRVTP